MRGEQGSLSKQVSRYVLIANDSDAQMLSLSTLNNTTYVRVELEIEKLKVHLFYLKNNGIYWL